MYVELYSVQLLLPIGAVKQDVSGLMMVSKYFRCQMYAVVDNAIVVVVSVYLGLTTALMLT